MSARAGEAAPRRAGATAAVAAAALTTERRVGAGDMKRLVTGSQITDEYARGAVPCRKFADSSPRGRLGRDSRP
ncbi:hypothetical protein GCM10010222_29210 [Streptomyces tanashiensis]|nr:hypothetical protein GCM10010222_29210 [Streptomyces tanashiensis]